MESSWSCYEVVKNNFAVVPSPAWLIILAQHGDTKQFVCKIKS